MQPARNLLITSYRVCADPGYSLYKLTTTAQESEMKLDQLDAALLRLFAESPRIGVLEASRQLGVARGTVQARLSRLEQTGAVSGWGPDIEAHAIGFPVTAFVTLEIRQGGGHDPVGQHLALIPEVIEAHTVTGPGDLWVRVVARSNSDLQRVLDRVVAYPGIERSATMISLSRQIDHRMLPLVEAATSPPQG
jgi:DNA-binding Lrp family transcriptional regulator